MKFLVFALLIVYVQATSEPFDAKKAFERTFHHCVKEHNLNEDDIKHVWDQELYPEDNKDFLIFYDCLMIDLNTYTEDGDFNFEDPRTEAYAKARLNLADDVDIHQALKDAVAHCFKTPKVEPKAVNAIKRRNCVLKHYREHSH